MVILSRLSSPVPSVTVIWPQVYVGVGLTALATLVLELALTRIFSVVFQYHFAFLAVSVALFGLGAGGLFSYAIGGHSKGVYWKLGLIAAANSLAVVGSLAFLLTRKGTLDNGTLPLIYVMSALPFFLGGMVICSAIGETVERIDRVYFFDLLGAAGGCLLLWPLLNYTGGPNTVIGAAVLYAASAAVWFTLGGSVRGRALAVILALALVLLIVVNLKWPVLDVRYAKGEQLLDELYVKWNSFSRIAVAPAFEPGALSIEIDAETSSPIANFDPDRVSEGQRRKLLYEGPGVSYVLRPGAKTLIIGPGGGIDVARALVAGSKDVTGVEINPIIANTIMRGRFSAASKHLYFRPEVRISVSDGRSYVSRSHERYQVLQVSLTEPRASLISAAVALAENNLFTTEAFEDYLTHLTEDGLMIFTRWDGDPPRESLRLVVLAVEALRRLGEPQPGKHIIVLREKPEAGNGDLLRDTVLVARKPFSAADVERCHALVAQNGPMVVYDPRDTDARPAAVNGAANAEAANPFASLLASDPPANYIREYRYDVSAVNDNRPYFSYTAHPREIWSLVSGKGRGRDGLDALDLLLRLIGVSVLATAVVLIVPPIVLSARLPRDRRLRRFLWYFVFVGVGYILIEVALIQKFVLFLGHPTYALTVIVFSLLVSSGAGSYYSRMVGTTARSLVGVLAVVSLFIAALAVVISPVVSLGGGWPLPLKVLVTVLLIAPVGFVMGMPFPAGLALLHEQYGRSIRWAWSLNSAASVMGSVFSVLLAIHLGLRETLLCGGVMYLLAMAALRLSETVPVPEPSGAAERGHMARA